MNISLSITDILRLIPHRYPMLLLDAVHSLIPGEKATGVKNVTINEPFFTGHFPQKPVMPGVLIVEALAQTAGVLVAKTRENLHMQEEDPALFYFMSMDKVKFRNPVYPGHVLHLHVKKKQARGNTWKFEGQAFVNDVIMAEAEFLAMMVREET